MNRPQDLEVLANCPMPPLVVHYSAAQMENIYRTGGRPGHGTVGARFCLPLAPTSGFFVGGATYTPP
jgi:hypothetical protein